MRDFPIMYRYLTQEFIHTGDLSQILQELVDGVLGVRGYLILVLEQ